MRAKDPKLALLQWVDEQYHLDPRAKFILHKLALYCDVNARGWAKVEELARGTNSSVRTVQNVLKAFRQDGLIRLSGEEHTLNPGSRYPRKVPVYQLACGVEDLDPDIHASGAEFAPEATLGCKLEHAGVQLAAPLNEPKGTNSPSDEGEARAHEREALFEGLEQAYPKRGLGFTNRPRARAAFFELLDRGVDGDLLIRAAAGFAADRTAKRTDQALEYWLADGKYRGWWPDPQQAASGGEAHGMRASAQSQPGAAPPADQALWDQAMAEMLVQMGDQEFGSYLRPAYLGQHEDRLFVVALTATARQRIAERRWRQVQAAWANSDARRRPLELVSKNQFEALRTRQSIDVLGGVK